MCHRFENVETSIWLYIMSLKMTFLTVRSSMLAILRGSNNKRKGWYQLMTFKRCMHTLRENLIFHFGVMRRFLTVNQVMKKERTPQKSEEERQSYTLREHFSIAERKAWEHLPWPTATQWDHVIHLELPSAKQSSASDLCCKRQSYKAHMTYRPYSGLNLNLLWNVCMCT